MRAAWALPAMLFLLAGCGHVSGGSSGAGGDYKLYEAANTKQSQLLAVIDSRARTTERRLPFGTPSLDWKHLYSVSSGSLVDTDPATGTVLHKVRLSGPYDLPNATINGIPGGLSQNGQWLVLQSWSSAPAGPITATHMLVFNTTFGSPPARIELNGNFEFDAVSNDGHLVYLIEYLGGSDYRVRVFAVSANQLDPQVVVDKSDSTQSMTGSRLMGVASADGQWLFSVYVRQTSGAFIHALNLGGRFAYCIDLLGSGYATNGDEFDWSLALSPDGNHLYAANATMGVVSEINTQDLDVARTVRLSANPPATSFLFKDVEAKAFGNNSTVLSPDGSTLVTAAAAGVLWIDTATLQVRARALTDWRVWSLGLSPDGRKLYAVRDSGSIAQISMAGRNVEDSFDPLVGDPVALIRVAPA
jgi:hypothetical protein